MLMDRSRSLNAYREMWELMENARKWTIEDEKAKIDIIFAIKPSELKQVKECNTSREL